MDVGTRGDQPEGELREDAERAERAVHHLEDERVLVVRRAVQPLAGGGQHLIGQAGVVKAAVLERHRLQRAARHRAADRDGLQLRHDDGRQPERQGGVHQVDERHPGLRRARAGVEVDLEDLVEIREIDLVVTVLAVPRLRDLV